MDAYGHVYYIIIIYLCVYSVRNFSKLNTRGTKEMVQLREVSGLERSCMYSK